MSPTTSAGNCGYTSRYLSISSVGPSAQCRSSSISANGRCTAAVCSSPATAANITCRLSSRDWPDARCRRVSAELRNQTRELASVLGPVLGQQLLRGEPGVVGEDLHERLVGDAELGVAPPAQHGRAGFVQLRGDLGGQAGLADPRLADDEQRPWLTLADLAERRRAACKLGAASHQLPLGEPDGERAEAGSGTSPESRSGPFRPRRRAALSEASGPPSGPGRRATRARRGWRTRADPRRAGRARRWRSSTWLPWASSPTRAATCTAIPASRSPEQLALAGVDAGPQLNAEPGGGDAQLLGAAHRRTGRVERDQEAVAAVGEHAAAGGVDRLVARSRRAARAARASGDHPAWRCSPSTGRCR